MQMLFQNAKSQSNNNVAPTYVDKLEYFRSIRLAGNGTVHLLNGQQVNITILYLGGKCRFDVRRSEQINDNAVLFGFLIDSCRRSPFVHANIVRNNRLCRRSIVLIAIWNYAKPAVYLVRDAMTRCVWPVWNCCK